MAFPTAASTGLPYSRFIAKPRDFASITDSWEYEDGGMDFNRRTGSPAYIWEVEFAPMSYANMAQFDTFWESVGIDSSFSFTDKYSVTWTGVRVKEYSRAHPEHRSWNQVVAFTLIKYV